MKKLILIPALLLGSLAMAQDYNYELSPMIGYNIAEGNLGLDNDGYLTGGLEFQVNSADSKISPELSIYYAPNVDYSTTGSTDVIRGAFNGVYTFNKRSSVVPFAKAGLGLETFTTNKANNSDSLFLDAGVGAKVAFTDNLALKLEAIYMLKPDSAHAGNADSNLLTLVGLTYSFGARAQKEPVIQPKEVVEEVAVATVVVPLDSDNDGVIDAKDKCANTPANTPVDADGCAIPQDNDNDGVLNAQDKCPNTPADTKVDANGCKVNLDTDNDGVLNANDLCPNTPIGTKVNSDGCPAKINLHITFGNNSTKVSEASQKELDKYATFLTTYTNYSAKIVGYTDSVGSAAYNKKLSQKRADAVVKSLIERGVNPSQLSAKGMGEADAIADNSTKEGRAKNRRIEAELIRH
ncbi:OmpA family protein [Sulfurimonas sp.]